MSVIEDTRDIYQRAIDAFGEEHQMNKAIEEAGEFIAANARILNAKGGTPNADRIRGKIMEALNGEAADLFIMMQQWRLIVGAAYFDTLINDRLARLEQLIADAGDK